MLCLATWSRPTLCHAPCLEVCISLLNIVKLKQFIISYDEGIPNIFQGIHVYKLF